MNKLLAIFSLILILPVVSCGPSFSSYQEFRSSPEDEQMQAITTILESNNIVPQSKFVVEYINRMLHSSSGYRQLETQIPEARFGEFLGKAVPILYYSYSPENLQMAPGSWQERAKKFIVGSVPYHYGYGDQQFRAFLKEKVDEYDQLVFRYTLEDGEHPDEAWQPSAIALQHDLLHLFAWNSGRYTFADFKRLNTVDQSNVLRKVWWANMISNNRFDGDSKRYLDIFQAEWQSKGRQYLKSETLQSLEEDASIETVADKVIQVVQDRY